jgi:hypothetical protein
LAAFEPLTGQEDEAAPLVCPAALSRSLYHGYGNKQNLSGAGGSKLSMMGTKKASDEKKLTRGIGKSN